MNNTEILRTNDVGKRIGIGRDKAYALMKSSGFPSTKLGKTYFVTEENFREWLKTYAGKEFKI